MNDDLLVHLENLQMLWCIVHRLEKNHAKVYSKTKIWRKGLIDEINRIYKGYKAFFIAKNILLKRLISCQCVQVSFPFQTIYVDEMLLAIVKKSHGLECSSKPLIFGCLRSSQCAHICPCDKVLKWFVDPYACYYGLI
jgi:hypothetical protein